MDREKHSTLKNAISNGSLDQGQNGLAGCLPQCISVDIRRRPISALAANSFWSGVSEIKDVLTTGNPLLESNTRSETAKFYVVEDDVSKIESTLNKTNPDHFFEDISTLYQRQTALFQRSCEQLKDLYQIQGYQTNTNAGGVTDGDHQADANVSEFVLVDNSKVVSNKSDDVSSSETTTDTLEGKNAILYILFVTQRNSMLTGVEIT